MIKVHGDAGADLMAKVKALKASGWVCPECNNRVMYHIHPETKEKMMLANTLDCCGEALYGDTYRVGCVIANEITGKKCPWR